MTVDPRGVCPTGWRVPGNGEWQSLINEQGGDAVAGGKLKSLTSNWFPSPNSGSTNESGFAAEPSGSRGAPGHFSGLRFYGVWWSTWMPNPPNDPMHTQEAFIMMIVQSRMILIQKWSVMQLDVLRTKSQENYGFVQMLEE